MNPIKIERYNDLFVKEISSILQTEVKDQNIRYVTITDVSITNDLSFAKVYYTIRNREYLDVTQKSLERAKSFIRKKLSERVEIRHTPELQFLYDESIEYGEKIEKILDQIQEEREDA